MPSFAKMESFFHAVFKYVFLMLVLVILTALTVCSFAAHTSSKKLASNATNAPFSTSNAFTNSSSASYASNLASSALIAPPAIVVNDYTLNSSSQGQQALSAASAFKAKLISYTNPVSIDSSKTRQARTALKSVLLAHQSTVVSLVKDKTTLSKIEVRQHALAVALSAAKAVTKVDPKQVNSKTNATVRLLSKQKAAVDLLVKNTSKLFTTSLIKQNYLVKDAQLQVAKLAALSTSDADTILTKLSETAASYSASFDQTLKQKAAAADLELTAINSKAATLMDFNPTWSPIEVIDQAARFILNKNYSLQNSPQKNKQSNTQPFSLQQNSSGVPSNTGLSTSLVDDGTVLPQVSTAAVNASSFSSLSLTAFKNDALTMLPNTGFGVNDKVYGKAAQKVDMPLLDNTGPMSLRAQVAIHAALLQVGKPYVFAASGPDTFDCSGLTLWAWGTAGVPLAHFAYTQWTQTLSVASNSMQPGDLVFFGPDLHHVGLYLGDGWMVDAPFTGTTVRLDKILEFKDFVGAARP